MYSRGRKIRTLTNGFGDRDATITPYPYNLMGLERLHFHLKALPNVLTSTYTTTPYIFGKPFFIFGVIG